MVVNAFLKLTKNIFPPTQKAAFILIMGALVICGLFICNFVYAVCD